MDNQEKENKLPRAAIQKLDRKTPVCTQCGSEDFTPISTTQDSKIKCDKCGAIFFSLTHLPKEEAGVFTGTYAPIPKSVLYKT